MTNLSFCFRFLSFLLVSCLFITDVAAQTSTTTLRPRAAPVSNANISPSLHAIKFVNVTFYLRSGNLSSATPECPPEATGGPSIIMANASSVYDSNLNSAPIYAGFTCQIAQSYLYGKDPAATLAASPYYVSTTPPGSACRYRSGAFDGSQYYCFQGKLTDLNTVASANTSICYNDFPGTTKYCNLWPDYRKVAVFSRPNGNSTLNLSNGTRSVPIPLCSANQPLLINLPANGTYTLNYSRPWAYGESCDGSNCGHFASGTGYTCNREICPPQGGINSTACLDTGYCSLSNVTIVKDNKNAVTVNPETNIFNYISDSSSYPFVWLANRTVCSISQPVQSTPIFP